ncbi:MAG: menaquinone biosynthesis decarboxylase [Thaumarchaeota archaeon S15]|nr:MAG: menaquinone biosynthesis decarboxylase [Thaumarchaeota archaeon S15]
MALEDLGEFVGELERAGELRRVTSEVSADLEIAEILRRVTYANGPAVLFENVAGSDIPVLGNAFGSMRRMEIALGTADFEGIGSRIADLARMEVPSGILGKIKKLPELSKMGDAFPKEARSGPVTEVTGEGTLAGLPILRTWPHDAGRFVTFGLVVTRHPETGTYNLGVYRMQVVDDTHAIMHWQRHKRGAQHHEAAREGGGKTEAAVVIGADPATVFAAVAPVPEGLDKYLFAGIVRRSGIETIRCRTVDLRVPARAEIVLEGHVDAADMRDEGPFGDHTGFYTPVGRYPTFTVTGIMRRKRPTYLATVVGKPVLEDAYIGKAIERSFLPLLRMMQPEIVDFAMPPAGWFHGLAVVSIKKRYPGQAKKVMMGLWGMGQLSLTKAIVVVDDGVNVHDANDVIWAVTTRADPARDTVIIDGAPTDTLDPASPRPNHGSKMGIDATAKTREEGHMREEQEPVAADEATRRLVDSRWAAYGLGETGA